MSIEAMRLALDALKAADKGIIPGGIGSDERNLMKQAITALRQAIQEAALQQLTDIHQEMEQKPVAWWNPDESGLAFQRLRGDWQPLYAAPVHTIDINQKRVDETAKDKHEPDVYGDGNVYRGQRSKDSTTKTLHWSLFVAAQESLREQAEERRAEFDNLVAQVRALEKQDCEIIKREWQGLTDDEVNEFAAGCHLGNSVQGAIYKAQAKLKEKNT